MRDASQVYLSQAGQLLVVPGADPETFSVISSGGACGNYFGRDARHVYDGTNPLTKDIGGSTISDDIYSTAEPSSFQLLYSANGACSYYEKDSRTVFYQDSFVANADPASFTALSNPFYAKDKQRVYYKGQFINWAQPDSFVPLGANYAKDASRVYHSNPGSALTDVVSGADLATFSIVQGNPNFDAEDKNYKYLNGRMVQ